MTSSEIKDFGADSERRRIDGSDDWTCKIKIINACPPDWNIHIVEGSAEFFYRDGSNGKVGPDSVDLVAGQSHVFASNDPSGCVEKVVNVVSVVVSGAPAQVLRSTSDPIPEDQCLMSDTVKLEPKHAVPKGELASQCVSREIVLNRLTSY